MDDNKKKLRVLTSASKTVLPEVLPDPRRASSSPSTAPRARTLAHMQRLLATAAAVSVASVSCGKEAKTQGSERQSGCNPNKKEAQRDDAGNIGYAVVDPMPTPAYCPGIAPLITTSAKFLEQGGATTVIVTLSTATGRDDFKYVSDAPAVGYGGTVTKTEVKPDGTMLVMMKLAPGTADAATASVSISVKGTCNQGPSTLSVSVSWTGPAKTATPGVYVNEY